MGASACRLVSCDLFCLLYIYMCIFVSQYAHRFSFKFSSIYILVIGCTNRVLPRQGTGHSKQPLPTTQEKTLHMDIIRWSTPKSDWLYSLQAKIEKLYTVSKIKTGSWLSLRSWTLIAKFRLKLKKVGKTTRPFTYDLNQIPYEYTVKVRNRFKGLDLIECLMNYGRKFVTLYRIQGSRPFPWKRNAKSKMAVWGGLTNSYEKKRSEKQSRKGKI